MSGNDVPLDALSPVSRPKKPDLGHPHGEIARVIQDKNLDRQVVVHDGLQLLNIHLDAAIASHADDALAGTGEGRPDGGGQVVTHGRRAGVGDQALVPPQTQGLKGHDAGACIAADDDVIVGEPGGELLDEVIRVERRTGLALVILHDRITPNALPAPGEPRSVGIRSIIDRVALAEQFRQKALQVAVDRQSGWTVGFRNSAASIST